jgi:hypothetical protein
MVHVQIKDRVCHNAMPTCPVHLTGEITVSSVGICGTNISVYFGPNIWINNNGLQLIQAYAHRQLSLIKTWPMLAWLTFPSHAGQRCWTTWCSLEKQHSIASPTALDKSKVYNAVFCYYSIPLHKFQ